MKKLKLLIKNFFIILLLSSCASINDLPQSYKDVNFNNAEGKTGWSKWEETFFIKNIDTKTAYLATKSGMNDAGFTIKKANFEELTVLGEHGMTAYDWNIVAGAYLKPSDNGVEIKTIVQGSKDIGFWGDMTEKSWNQEIFKGIREYIYLESNINETSKNHFR